MISDIIEIIVKLLLALIVFVALFPVIWFLSTPFILVGALFVSGDYRSNIKKGYKAVSQTCMDWAACFIP